MSRSHFVRFLDGERREMRRLSWRQKERLLTLSIWESVDLVKGHDFSDVSALQGKVWVILVRGRASGNKDELCKLLLFLG